MSELLNALHRVIRDYSEGSVSVIDSDDLRLLIEAAFAAENGYEAHRKAQAEIAEGPLSDAPQLIRSLKLLQDCADASIHTDESDWNYFVMVPEKALADVMTAARNSLPSEVAHE